LAKNGSKRGSSSGTPRMLVWICTPRAPSSATARSVSSIAPSTSESATAAAKPTNRSGWSRHSSAMLSFAQLARSAATADSPNASTSGCTRVSTWT
jgi:hypothetical protein